MVREIIVTIKRELTLDFRNLASLASVVLFLLGSAFIAQKSFVTIHAVGWVALFWILYLFSLINVVLGSANRSDSINTLTAFVYLNPTTTVIGQWLYRTMLGVVVGLLLMGILTVFFGSPISDYSMFFTALTVGGIGLSTVLTFVGLITRLLPNTHVLTSILTFPLALPFLLLSIKISVISVGTMVDSSVSGDIIRLIAVTLLVIGLGLLLLPNIWKS